MKHKLVTLIGLVALTSVMLLDASAFFSKQSMKTACKGFGACSAGLGLCVTYLLAEEHSEKLNKINKRNELLQREWVDIVEKSGDAQVCDPNLWKVFCKIKEDLGILEHIPLYVVPKSFGLRGDYEFRGMYVDHQKAVLVREGALSGVRGIFTLVHELEHHRQNMKYRGSYHGSYGAKQEHAADAAAAGYFDCRVCLEGMVKSEARDRKDNNFSILDPEEKGIRYTRMEGYFGPQDFDSYVKQTLEDGCLCKAHQDNATIDDRVNLRNYMPQLRNL